MSYKQSLFNAAPSATTPMMDLSSFMRDYRTVEERFATLSGQSSSYYDKNITPAHMFGKNLQQVNSTAALQQMFNSTMTTMAYGREQQNLSLSNYQSRLNASQMQSPINAHSSSIPNAQAVDPKPKKPRKKKNPSPELPSNPQVAANQQQQHHQHVNTAQHSQQQLQQQQMAAHQSFQSYSGLKIPSTPSGSASEPPISLSVSKSIVPGSAFNYGPAPIPGLYGENPSYLDEFRGTGNPYYPGLAHRSTPNPPNDKTSTNPPAAHPQPSSTPYIHLLPPDHPSRASYPFMNAIDPAALQQQYRMMMNQTYQAGYHPALGMHNQPPHWHM